MEMNYTLHCGDCLDVMPTLEVGSVDAIIADLPYGTTACKWDVVIPFEPLWTQFKRVIKKRGAVVLFGSDPFTSLLICSNLEWFKYKWVWDKKRGNGHLVAKFRPMQRTEDISVFGNGATTYNPQMTKRNKSYFSHAPASSWTGRHQKINNDYEGRWTDERYPVNVLEYSWSPTTSLHPSQKPLPLLEYLVLTYTNPGELVLDCTMGSGTTGAACIRTGRRFIGIEKDPGYFETASKRLEQVQAELKRQPALMGIEEWR